RREGEVEVLAGLQAALLEDRQEPLTRRTRVRRRLEHDEVALAEPGRDPLRRLEDDRQVRLALVGERRREGDQERVGLAPRVVVAGGGEAPGVDQLAERLRGDVLDVALAAVELLDPRRLRLDEHDRAAGLA